MEITAVKNNIFEAEAEVLAFGVFRTERLGGAAGTLDKKFKGLISKEAEAADFTGKAGEILDISAGGVLGAKRTILFGLGELKSFGSETLRRAAGAVLKTFKNKKYKTLALSFGDYGRIKGYEAAKALAEGLILASYEFDKYKIKKEKKPAAKGLEKVIFAAGDSTSAREAEKGILSAKISAEATLYARDLVNEPASVCVPSHLAEHARQIAKTSKGAVKVRIFGREEARAKGMEAFLAVAAGAGEEPYFIHLYYKHPKAKTKIALVGKGITFDSGGLQTKPGESMATMKLDMAGAAAVLGVFSRIKELDPRAEVHGIIAATENMPGPRAYKPGDIVRAMNGKTIEIGHTDAEGRVTLADSLSYAAKLKPDFIIDLATLTGACMVALGEEVTGLMSNNKKLSERIFLAAKESGEKIWELPLVPEYRDIIKGMHADVRNSGGTRYGGAITAGLFLEEFVSGVPWAHLDIAGPAWAERATIPYIPLGGTGYGVRTLMELLKKI